MSVPRFQEALDAGTTTYEVSMNCVRHVVFSPSSSAILTRDLNDCTEVAVISSSTAILAHIPPQPYPTNDLGAGERNVWTRITEVLSLYRQNHTHFPPGRISLIVGTTFSGEPALPHQLQMIESLLQQHGLSPIMKSYYTARIGGHSNAAQGTVFIDARSGTPKVYIEDQQVAL